MTRYCTETHLSPFLLYLPFTLLLAPLALTACEKIFIGYGFHPLLYCYIAILLYWVWLSSFAILLYCYIAISGMAFILCYILPVNVISYDFRLYGTESKLEEFYSLLVKESLGREDVNSMETENLK